MFCDFFNINDESVSLRKFKNATLKLINNDSCYVVLRDVADAASFLIRTILDDDPEIESITVNLEDDYNDFFLISNYLNRKMVVITVDNVAFLKNVSEFFQISSLMLKIEEFDRHYTILAKDINITTLETFESILSSLSEENFENVAENMNDFKLVDDKDSEFDFEIIGYMIFKFIQNRYLSAPLLLKFVKRLNNDKITNTIINLTYQIKKDSVKNYIFQLITDLEVSGSLKYYNYGDRTIFNRLYKPNNYEDEDDLSLLDDIYVDSVTLSFLQNSEQIKKEITDYELLNRTPKKDEKNEDDQKSQKKSFLNFFKKNQVETNEMTLPKFCQICTTLRQEGVNPSMICLSMRNDDVDLFQKICSNDDQFNFGQKVPFSRFESSSMLVQCTLAEYAAFFGSVKCFKHILINYNNGSSFSESEKKIVKYAIAGRSNEIVRLCEQNGCSFCTSALKSCIRFRNQEIFEWIIMNKTKLYGMNIGCTINVTGKHYVKQPWFECDTCKINSPYGCCLYCATHCHKGHKLNNRGLSNAFCDCSLINHGRYFCKGMARVIFKTNEDENSNENENENENSNENDNKNENSNENENENSNKNENKNENSNENKNENSNENDNKNENSNDNDNKNENYNKNDNSNDNKNNNYKVDNRILGNFGEYYEDLFFFDDDFDESKSDDDNADWAPVDDIVHPSYRSSSMVGHLDNLSLSQVDSLVFACVSHHNYAMLRRLIELGANLMELYPKFFTMAAATNNVRLAKLAIILGKPNSGNKYVYDELPESVGGLPLNRQIKKLGVEAEKMGIISVEKMCNIC